MSFRITSLPPWLAIVGSLIGVAVGCGGSSEPTGIGSPRFNLAARIEGRVFRTGGELIGIATVRTTVFLKGTECGSEPLAPPFEVETDEEGGYSQSLTFSGNDEFDACLTIEAIPPPGSELRPSSTVREIEIRPLNEGIQTIRVDFELAP